MMWRQILFVSMLAFWPWTVMAQEAEAPPAPVSKMPAVAATTGDAIMAAAPAPAPAPAAFAATAPAAAAASDGFPSLPPSRPCVKEDIDGLWRLNKVYESPTGDETAIYSSQPYQYLLFLDDDTFRSYRSPWPEKSDSVAMLKMQTETQANLLQFVVSENGLVFFYRDGVAYDTQACFIVANQRAPFAVGQMLLMPPEGQSTARVVKVYDHTLSLPNANRAGTKAVQKHKKKKKGKRAKRRKNRQQ